MSAPTLPTKDETIAALKIALTVAAHTFEDLARELEVVGLPVLARAAALGVTYTRRVIERAS